MPFDARPLSPPPFSEPAEGDEPVLEDNIAYAEAPLEAPTYEVVASRNQPRVAGKLCIEVIPKDTGVTEKWPLEVFIDKDGDFTNDEVCNWVNHWNEVASLHPDVRRLCLMCSRRAVRGRTLCGHCSSNGFDEIIYA